MGRKGKYGIVPIAENRLARIVGMDSLEFADYRFRSATLVARFLTLEDIR
jgi:hypothetical protein